MESNTAKPHHYLPHDLGFDLNEVQPARPASDWELMERLARGDERALSEIISRHEQSLLSFAYRYLGDADEAQDAVQEVFVRAYKNAPKYQPTAQLRTWLFRICVNVSLTAIRRRKRSPLFGALRFWSGPPSRDPEERTQIESLPAAPRSQPTFLSAQKELGQQVRAAVDRLPANQKAAILLRHFDELSYQEISDALSCSVSSVESLLFRARQRLAKELEPYVSS